MSTSFCPNRQLLLKYEIILNPLYTCGKIIYWQKYLLLKLESHEITSVQLYKKQTLP